MTFLKLFSAFSLIFIFTSCNPPSGTLDTPKENPGKIIIGHNPWSGNIPIYVADEKGFFTEEGLEVELQATKSLGELTRLYVDGVFHARTNLVLDAVQETMEGLDHRILFAIDYSNGADAIIADASIKEPKDLMGKKVGYEKGTLTEFFFHHVLMQAGYNLDDVVHVEAGAEEAAILLVEGKINAAVTYEPYLGNALNTGKCHLFLTSKDYPGLITDVFTVRQDFLEKYPEATLKLCKAYFKALDYVLTHKEEAHAFIAKEWKLTPEEIAEQLNGLRLIDLAFNQRIFQVGSAIDSIYGNVKHTHEFLNLEKKIFR